MWFGIGIFLGIMAYIHWQIAIIICVICAASFVLWLVVRAMWKLLSIPLDALERSHQRTLAAPPVDLNAPFFDRRPQWEPPKKVVERG